MSLISNREKELVATVMRLQLEGTEGAGGDGDGAGAGESLDSSDGEFQQEPYDTEKEMDKALIQIFSFLDPKSLRRARLVCKKWNNLALPLFPFKRVALYIKPSTKGVVGPVEPRLFARLHLPGDCVKGLELAVKGKSCHQIRHLTSWGLQGMNLVTKGISTGVFRNLSTLIFATAGFEQVYAGCFHTIPKVGSLSTLTTLRLRTDPGHKKSCYLYHVNQCLINTAPNLRTLESHQVFNLQNKKYLTRLVLDLTEEIPRVRTLYDMLNAVKSTLTHLELRDVTPSTPMPVMEAVRYLAILSASGDNNWELAELFPNLKKLKNRVFAFDNVLVSRYIEASPQNLRFFETHCCFSSKDLKHSSLKDVTRALRRHLPKLEVFKVQTSCPLAARSGGSHLLNIIVNLSFKHVIVMDLRVAFNLVEAQKNLILQLAKAKVKPKPDDQKGNILEFRGGPWDQFAFNVEDTSEKENKKMIENFPNVVLELGKRWKFIHFKYVMLDAACKEKLKQAIKEHSLPTEIFSANGTGPDTIFHMDRDVYKELMQMAHYVRTENLPTYRESLNNDENDA